MSTFDFDVVIDEIVCSEDHGLTPDEIEQMGAPEIYLLEDFVRACLMGVLNDYDGHGVALIGDATTTTEAAPVVLPSRLDEIPVGTTRIVWYNK